MAPTGLVLAFALLGLFFSRSIIPATAIPVNSLNRTWVVEDRMSNTTYDTTAFIRSQVTTVSSGQAVPAALRKRQCTWAPWPGTPYIEGNEATGDWNCDDKLPTINEMIYRMQHGPGGLADAQHHAAFYAHVLLDDPDNYKAAAALVEMWFASQMNGQGLPYYYANNALSQSWYDRQWAEVVALASDADESASESESEDGTQGGGLQLTGQQIKDQFAACYSEALAWAVINPDVYFFTNDQTGAGLQTVWARNELPVLTQNKYVKRIWRVDPRGPPLSDPCHATLVWSRSEADGPNVPHSLYPIDEETMCDPQDHTFTPEAAFDGDAEDIGGDPPASWPDLTGALTPNP